MESKRTWDNPANPSLVGNQPAFDLLKQVALGAAKGNYSGLHHAWIFGGPDGVGKFQAALWWAAALKCTNSATSPLSPGESCGDCESCRCVSLGTHRDVTTIEPEVSRAGIARLKIDQCRDLLRSLRSRPLSPGPRVAIVRDADTMTVDAQNSLLKLLEEPPGFTVIVLVSANVGALLATIRSRCRVLSFAELDRVDIRQVLVAHGRSPQTAEAAALASCGSLAKALALDEQALAAREELLLEFEDLASGGSPGPALLAAMASRAAALEILQTLLQWQRRKIEVSLGAEADGFSPVLAKALARARASDSADPTAALVATGQRLISTIGAIRRNANWKIAANDLFINMRV